MPVIRISKRRLKGGLWLSRKKIFIHEGEGFDLFIKPRKSVYVRVDDG